MQFHDDTRLFTSRFLYQLPSIRDGRLWMSGQFKCFDVGLKPCTEYRNFMLSAPDMNGSASLLLFDVFSDFFFGFFVCWHVSAFDSLRNLPHIRRRRAHRHRHEFLHDLRVLGIDEPLASIAGIRNRCPAAHD